MLTKAQETTIRREVTGKNGKHDFGMWLFAINDNVAGRVVVHTDCPLSRYIRAIYSRHTNKGALVNVDQSSIRICYGDELKNTIRFRTPKWASVFIWKIDAQREVGSSVFGNEALEVLEVA